MLTPGHMQACPDCEGTGRLLVEPLLREQYAALAKPHLQGKQHPWDSFAEVVTNLLIGFLISMLAYAWVINPLFHLHTKPAGDFGIVGIFTLFSLMRQYVIRRAFNGKSPFAWFVDKYRKG